MCEHFLVSACFRFSFSFQRVTSLYFTTFTTVMQVENDKLSLLFSNNIPLFYPHRHTPDFWLFSSLHYAHNSDHLPSYHNYPHTLDFSSFIHLSSTHFPHASLFFLKTVHIHQIHLCFHFSTLQHFIQS